MPRLAGQVAHCPVVGLAGRPQLGHHAEHGHPAARVEGGERPQRGGHRRRVGVVGVVEDPGPRAAASSAPSASARRCPWPARPPRRRAARRTPARPPRRRVRSRPCGGPAPPAAPRPRPTGVARRNAGRSSPSRRTFSARTAPPSPKDSTAASVRAAIAATRGSPALRTAVPAAGSAATSSPLAAATASIEPKVSVWTAATAGHDPHRRPGDGAQRGDVPGAPRPHLDDRGLGAVVRAEQREGHAELVVERPGAGHGAPPGGERARRGGP